MAEFEQFEQFRTYYESGKIPKEWWKAFIKEKGLNPCICRLSAVVKWIKTNWDYTVSKELLLSRIK